MVVVRASSVIVSRLEAGVAGEKLAVLVGCVSMILSCRRLHGSCFPRRGLVSKGVECKLSGGVVQLKLTRVVDIYMEGHIHYIITASKEISVTATT